MKGTCLELSFAFPLLAIAIRLLNAIAGMADKSVMEALEIGGEVVSLYCYLLNRQLVTFTNTK